MLLPSHRHAISPAAFLAAGVFISCAPPPLPTGADTGADGPSIRFVFPTSSLASPVCSDFLVAVDIDNFEVVAPAPESAPIDGKGHWHLDDDITGDYYVLTDAYTELTADLDGTDSRSYRLTASLVNVDHTPLAQASFPASVATVEFEVADTSDCLGNGGGHAR